MEIGIDEVGTENLKGLLDFREESNACKNFVDTSPNPPVTLGRLNSSLLRTVNIHTQDD